MDLLLTVQTRQRGIFWPGVSWLDACVLLLAVRVVRIIIIPPSAAGAGRPDFGCRGSFQHSQFFVIKTRTTPRRQGLINVLILSNIIKMVYNQFNFARFRMTLNLGNFTLIHLFYLCLISYPIVESLSLSSGCLVIIFKNIENFSDQIVNFHWSHYSNVYLVFIHWETLNHIDSQTLKLEPVVTRWYPSLQCC